MGIIRYLQPVNLLMHHTNTNSMTAPKRVWRRLLTLCVTVLVASVGLHSAQAEQSEESQGNDFSARMVLFIADDAEAPDGYEKTLGSLATRTEAYFAQWMKHWKRDIEREKIFARNDDGTIQVTLVTGKLNNAAGRAALPEMRRLARAKASTQLKINPDENVVWWIFYDYPEMRGFQGGGNSKGGTAINKFPNGVDEISQKLDLAAPEMLEAAIKGTIHEFGHALGLPHNGPRPGLELGNSLMGPINRAYAQRVRPGEARVYLNESSAAILWKHPIFRAKSSRSPVRPQKVQTLDLKAEEKDDGSMITLYGTLKSDQSAHTAVLFDSERRGFGDYWTRSYTGAIDDQGRFSIDVEEPFARGKLMLFFCFDNGINTGNEQRQLMQGAVIEIPYSGPAGKRTFELHE